MQIKKGSKVTVDYEGKLDDGTVFDSSKHGDHSHPLEFEVGSGQVIKGFDDAVMGMKVGDEKNVRILCEDAYGEPKTELIREVPKKGFPEQAKEGMMIGLALPNGAQMPAVVKRINKDSVELDFNHPLAGKNLNFTIKIVKIL